MPAVVAEFGSCEVVGTLVAEAGDCYLVRHLDGDRDTFFAPKRIYFKAYAERRLGRLPSRLSRLTEQQALSGKA